MSNRKDNKGRVLKKGESQRKDGTYMYRWTDIGKKRQCIYAKSLNDLRKQEQQLLSEISNGVLRTDITLNQQIELYLQTKANISNQLIQIILIIITTVSKTAFLVEWS